MASFHPQDFGLDDPSPPPRPTTPPVRKAFLLVLLVLCVAASLVYGVPYVAERRDTPGSRGGRGRRRRRSRSSKRRAWSAAPTSYSGSPPSRSRPPSSTSRRRRFRRDNVVPGLPGAGGTGSDRGSKASASARAWSSTARTATSSPITTSSATPTGSPSGSARGPRSAPVSSAPTRRRTSRSFRSRPGGGRRRVGRLGQARHRRLGARHRQPVHARPHRHRRDRLGHPPEQPEPAGPDGRVRLSGLHPDRRGDQPRKLGRPAHRPQRPGHRDQHGHPHLGLVPPRRRRLGAHRRFRGDRPGDPVVAGPGGGRGPDQERQGRPRVPRGRDPARHRRLAKEYKLPDTRGAIVSQVQPGSPADRPASSSAT